MTRPFVLALMLLPVFFFIDASYAQVHKGSNEEEALEYVRELYSKSLSEQAGLYNGPEYVGYPYRIKQGIPFFLTNDVLKGEVYYDGMLYKNIPMWYDIAKDEVIVQHFDNFSKISLHKEKLDSFSISNHRFIRLDGETSPKYGLDNGFYDQIYQGKSEILVRRSKEFIRSTNQEGIWISFSGERKNIFLRTGEAYHPVSSQKSVLKALGKYEKEILAHLKQNKIRFRKEQEKAIIMMVSYYDQLNKQL